MARKARTPYRVAGPRQGTPEDAVLALLGQLDELGSGLNRVTYHKDGTVYKVNIRDMKCPDAKSGYCEHRHGESGIEDANTREFDRVLRAKRSGSPLKRYVAPTTKYIVRRGRRRFTVLAQPYLTVASELDLGSAQCWKCYDDEPHARCEADPRAKRLLDKIDDVCTEFGFLDMHEDNYGVTRNGEVRVFDVVGFN